MTREEGAAGVLDVGAARSRRDRNALTASGAAISARGISVVISFVSVPLAIGYLGVEQYGVLAALTALSTLFVFADLGIGNGLLNVASDALARDEKATVIRASSSATFMLLAVASVLAAVIAVASPFVDWSFLLGVGGTVAASDVGRAALVFLALFLIGLPFGAAERLRLAFQEGWTNSIAAVAGAIAGLGGLLVAIWLRVDLAMFVLALGLGPLLALVGNAIVLYARQRPWLAPRLKNADAPTAVGLARIGFLFLVLQLAMAIAFQSDVIVAAAVLGPEAAATYSLTLRLALLVPGLVGLYLVNLWPAYTEAIARGDGEWVVRTLRRSVIAAATLSGAASIGLVIFGSWFINAWTGGAIDPPLALLVGAAVWAVISASTNAVSILLNAASVVRFQVVAASVMAATSIILSVLLGQAIGISGIVFGTLIAYVVCSAIPIALYVPRLLHRIDEAPRPVDG